ncbi:hypothetical protein BJF93_11560 [Xaviernesmea oryzae]|uniref:Methyltransferase FkbM domain-containing protein n=1 Tax=Xaviernesmea oryzae TaxID=464029 RepID=A0A1Q9AVQ1_9HYPH|nr:hypothetical protein BJF93_11560 [Xaviernesmea oryzae]SEL63106.1 methyltransferase, FkbM family [Xaviernesmea oryzae]
MTKFLRSLRRRWRILTEAERVRLDGITIDTRKGHIADDIRALIFREAYEDTERALIRNALRPGMRVLEIGAGLGVVSLILARIAGPGKVLAYEANPTLEAKIRGNFALNSSLPELRMKALTVDGAPVRFFVDGALLSSSVYDRAKGLNATMVESDALPAVLADFRPDMLVIDVEGAEVDLLGLPNLDPLAHIIAELHPHIVGDAAIDGLIAHLARLGFQLAERNRKAAYFRRDLVHV